MKLLNIIAKRVRPLAFFAVAATAMFTTSCEDFLDVSSTTVIDANKDHLSSARDSIYSVIGVLNKMQAIADRTVLLGEARGDLVDITSYTSKDLRDVALFNVGDDNKYNSPRDYYAIINNCNYFIANVDTAMTNNRNENVYLNEYAVVKAVRAWTYLQLATTYGRVPFVTTPILSKDEGEASYPMYGIKEICDYFINEDGLCDLADNPNITYPWYGDIKGTPSRLFYIQMNLVLGDLYLWRASLTNSREDYLESAKRYYDYISKRNGTTTNSAYPTTNYACSWNNDTWGNATDSWSSALLGDQTNSANSEIISIIPMDSIKSEGYYSELRSIFCSDYNDDEKVSLVPSESLKNLSASQEYCYYDKNSVKFSYAPKGLRNHLDGDLRLAATWYTSDNVVNSKGERYTYQAITKHMYRKNGNISLYRRGQVYLRLAEAINRAGYPRFAYQILASGVNDNVVRYCVTPFEEQSDSATIAYFSFPPARYNVDMWRSDIPGVQQMAESNRAANSSIGIHSRGSGVSAFNDFYKMPYGEAIIDTTEVRDEAGDLIGYSIYIHRDSETPGLIEKQMEAVEDMIVNEQALETAFEGYRFYDLMRVAYRRNDPSYLANKIYARRGVDVASDITTNLLDPNNWFLKWNGQIGMQ